MSKKGCTPADFALAAAGQIPGVKAAGKFNKALGSEGGKALSYMKGKNLAMGAGFDVAKQAGTAISGGQHAGGLAADAYSYR